MELDLSKAMTMDEWTFLHTPEMYYAVYGENPDPERIALGALRSVKRGMWQQQIIQQMKQTPPEDYSINITSNVRVKK